MESVLGPRRLSSPGSLRGRPHVGSVCPAWGAE